MKTLLSLFDYSGQWSEPFYQAGWNVIQLDIKHGIDLLQFQSVDDVFEFGIEDVHGIIAAPPCTDFTISGAQYWPAKDLAGTTAKAMELVSQVSRFADLFTPTDPEYDEPFFWAVENPVGRLPKLMPEYGAPLYVQPYEFAGWLNHSKADHTRLDKIRKKDGQGVTAAECDHVVMMEAYTKKTGLWGCFNRDMIKKPVAPAKCASQGSFTQRFGGKSDKTKEARSHTPIGFARAFYEANCEWTGYETGDLFGQKSK